MVETAVNELVERLRAIGEERYHDKHPFHRKLVAGELTPDQVRSWVANRYYYQKAIPIKDAFVLAALPSRDYRRAWISRITDHDGNEHRPGGTEKWLALGRSVGLTDEYVLSERGVSAGTRFAVDAYVNFARHKSWLEAVASSLTELFGPPVMAARVAAIVEKYPWIERKGLAYFEDRLDLAKHDADQALGWVVDWARTPETQDACVAALRFKCDVLWCILDATALDCGVFG
ncbi:MAG: pyrroloquinoline-quinone synthase PqqC [Candidatus Eremiobacteraeota bacterium]|nr:pyrroloquinoline-quinone synthase PqqC [Candidatus Eremiobacteraeota bacterium]